MKKILLPILLGALLPALVLADGRDGYLGSRKELGQAIGRAAPKEARYTRYLRPPTFDGTNTITHPNIISLETNWNDFPYWLTYTPYPDATRERIHVAASRDLENWTGFGRAGNTNGQVIGSNEVWQATGWTTGTWTADPELYLNPDGELVCLFGMFRSPGISAVLASTSTKDGVNWTKPFVVRSNTTSTVWFAGPQVVTTSNNWLRLYYVDDNFTYSTNSLWYVDAIDKSGTNWDWENPHLCHLTTVATNTLAPWHFDMAWTGTNYLAIFGNQSISLGECFTSPDGVTWTLAAYPAFWPQAYEPSEGVYKPAFILRPGPESLPRLDIILGTQSSNGNDPAETNLWKLRLLRDFQPYVSKLNYNIAPNGNSRAYFKVENLGSGYVGLGDNAGALTFGNSRNVWGSGDTIVNAPSGGTISLKINNVSSAQVNASTVTLLAGIPLTVGGAGGPTIAAGSGAPSASSPNGSLYLRTDGTGPNLYVRENGAWVSK